MKGGSAIQRCCQRRSDDNTRTTKKKKTETKTKVCGLLSLPYDVTLRCLSQVSKLDLAALAIASKAHRSLVVCDDLLDLKHMMGCLTPSYHVCLHILGEPNPRWFILHPEQRRLKPIHLESYRAPKSSSSFVVMSFGIFIIGGLNDNGEHSAAVSFFNCFNHTWHSVEPMNMARASASAHLIGNKIYVIGGCYSEKADSSNWVEVFDIFKQTWEFVSFKDSPDTPLNIQQSVVVNKEGDIFAVDEDGQSFFLSPSKCLFAASGIADSKPVHTKDWCLLRNVILCHGTGGKILWTYPFKLDWQEVKGLEELRQQSLCMWRRQFGQPDTKVVYDIRKLSTTSDGNIVIFWSAQPQCESMGLCSAEISLKIRYGREIWGKVEWSGSVFKPDPPLYSSSIKVLSACYLHP